MNNGILLVNITNELENCSEVHEKIVEKTSNKLYRNEFFVDSVGQKQGLYKTYIDNSNQIIYLCTYKNNQKDGYECIFHDNYIIQLKTFKNNMLNGICIQWETNGKMTMVAHYKNNEANGICYRWDLEGHLISALSYKKDKWHGSYKTFRVDGSIEQVDYYKDGNHVHEEIAYEYNEMEDPATLYSYWN